MWLLATRDTFVICGRFSVKYRGLVKKNAKFILKARINCDPLTINYLSCTLSRVKRKRQSKFGFRKPFQQAQISGKPYGGNWADYTQVHIFLLSSYLKANSFRFYCEVKLFNVIALF
jgi:hypothetical protein